MIIEIEIPMRPVPKGRPRFSQNGCVYTDESTRTAEALIKQYARQAMRGRPLFEGALGLIFEAHYQRPAKPSKTYPKADLDNLIKICDALNKVVFDDDSQIIQITAVKKYSDKNCVKIKIYNIVNEAMNEAC